MPDLNGAEMILLERIKQTEQLGFTEEKDDMMVNSELLYLAQYCLFSNNEFLPPTKTWNKDYLSQLHLKPRIEQLTIAGALIAAEIDRRIRLTNKQTNDNK